MADLSSHRIAATTPIYAGIEYPGPVRSIPRALASLGGPAHVSSSLASSSGAGSKDASKTIELDLNPGNPFFHTVPSHQVATANVVMKVVKRRRKCPKKSVERGEDELGAYRLEVAGVVDKTVRFRCASPLVCAAGAGVESKLTLVSCDCLPCLQP